MEHAVSESVHASAAQMRSIVASTRGRAHGPITRIVSPSDIGELIKPFVFLDYFDFKPTGNALFPMHPHSGIATITVLLSGDLRYEDTTGASGILAAGSVEWMRAGNGVWHDASPAGSERFQGYQVWVALPRSLENGVAQSQYLPSEAVPRRGPARVVLGRHAGASSRVAAPDGMNLLHVHLAAGERWRYQPPAGHDVAWTHVHHGALLVSGDRLQGELAVFEESDNALEFSAEGETDFIVGSAVKHPHDLVLGYYSVHTSPEALQRGEAEIARIGRQLRADGRIR
jgi:redox-sensitive bicupin YhaK (pirin superfamily)